MNGIVVGVDGSECAGAAVRWALREASVHGARLTAVLVWSYLDQHHAVPGRQFDPAYRAADAHAALDAALEAAVGAEAADRVERRVVCDLPARGLLAAADGADLLVVGSRGLGGFKGLLLGSVSQQAAQHAPCPVVLVPSEDAFSG